MTEATHAMPLRECPITDERRQRLRDDRLWVRELQRARLFNLKRIHCPCSKCKGRRKLLIPIVRDHLIQNARDPGFRVWRGPRERDASNEEWEDDFCRPPDRHTIIPDAQVEMRQDDAFQQADDAQTLEERVQNDMIAAFTVADKVHKVCNRSNSWDEYITDCAVGDDAVGENDLQDGENDLQDGENDHQDRDEGTNLDPHALEEAIKSLYVGALSYCI
jgi:hypothetical protein